MNKIKFSIGFILLSIFCFLYGKFSLLFNYILALIMHELAHLWVAESKGYTLSEIKFGIFGLSMNLNETVKDDDLFVVNIAGPIINFILAVLSVILMLVFPSSIRILNTFCFANFALAFFNLLPIYPLDGWKIFYSLIKNKNTFKKLDKVFRSLVSLFLMVLTFLFAGQMMLLLLPLALIVITPFKTKTINEYLFPKNKKNLKSEVKLVAIDKSANLYDLAKQISNKDYKIFYFYDGKHHYFTEEEFVNRFVLNKHNRFSNLTND